MRLYLHAASHVLQTTESEVQEVNTIPLDAAAGTQEIPRVIGAAGCERVRDPLRVGGALYVADGACSTAQTSVLVFLRGADDDSAALALGGGQRSAHVFGREVLRVT